MKVGDEVVIKSLGWPGEVVQVCPGQVSYFMVKTPCFPGMIGLKEQTGPALAR
jgi:hypothetical protein